MTRSLAISAILLVSLSPQEKQKSYRLPSTDLKQRVLWGSTLEVPDGPSLAFGGQDQQSEDGNPHTRIKVDGEWKSIYEQLRAANPHQAQVDRVRGAAAEAKALRARARFAWFDGRDVAIEVPSVLEGPELDAEPPPRALSPIAYDAKTKLFFIFGGDHLDYLTNDTWVFDAAQRRWSCRRPATAPPPRANHVLKAAGDGRIVLTGGYTYTSSTDYVGGQYRDLGDGEWTYDLLTDAWMGKGGVAPDSRVFRTGRLHPDFYQQGPKPDPAAFATWLAAVPANTWIGAKPPYLPALNRDWGTAVLDSDRDLILRWSGGHSAHGGTDVLQYHLRTNRWELPNPVEFPLGQLYSNTEYPDGWNFNHRPWITGHTYQNYGYDPILKRMLFTGRREHCYIYDPDLGDWTTRFAKPKGMAYGDCFYTLTLTPTPQGLVCWTQEGKLFRFKADGSEWV
ncbi:MAG TPA: kelch repeat-containing protein, partial [Planctomycetota bacterium]|nr:kelch repeat-containing protein [Planctomycetota bacterium]